MTGFVAALLSIGVLAAFALAGGGLYLLVKRRDRKRGLLMLGAAIVLFLNVFLWSLPPPAG